MGTKGGINGYGGWDKWVRSALQKSAFNEVIATGTAFCKKTDKLYKLYKLYSYVTRLC